MQNNYLKVIGDFLRQIQPLQPIATRVEPKLSPKLNLKTIVFDIYGTLIVSASGDLDQATISIDNLTRALTASGFLFSNNQYEIEAKAILKLFKETVREHQQQLREKGHPYPEVDIIKVWEQCFAIAKREKWIVAKGETDIKLHTVIFEILSNPVWPMTEMSEVLNELQKKQLPLGIVSNAQFYTPILMNYFLNNQVIADEYIHGFADEISVFSYKILRSKPDVFLFERLAENLKKHYQIKPEETLFVGNDMLKDVWTANQLGFKTALFAADERSLRLREHDERTKNLQPDYVITDLKQLLQLI